MKFELGGVKIHVLGVKLHVIGVKFLERCEVPRKLNLTLGFDLGIPRKLNLNLTAISWGHWGAHYILLILYDIICVIWKMRCHKIGISAPLIFEFHIQMKIQPNNGLGAAVSFLQKNGAALLELLINSSGSTVTAHPC